MSFLKKLLGIKDPHDTIKGLVVSRCTSDPANFGPQNPGPASEAEVRGIVEKTPREVLLGGSPEGVVFRLVETYSKHLENGVPDGMALRMADRLFAFAAVRAHEQRLSRALTEKETESVIEAEMASLPSDLTLERYLDFRLLKKPNPGISKPYLDAARIAARKFYKIPEDAI